MTNVWIDDIAGWFDASANRERFARVIDYTGCRELWLQAELALWLHDRCGLDANGTWDTNYLVADYGRLDLAVPGDDGLDLALEIKVLGGSYQRKVLTGRAGTLSATVTELEARNWRVDPSYVESAEFSKLFGLLPDYKRLHGIWESVRETVLLLVVDNRSGKDTDLGRALASIEFESTATRSHQVAPDVYARLWRV